MKTAKIKLSYCSQCGHACVLLCTKNGAWNKQDKNGDKLVSHACSALKAKRQSVTA